MTVIWILFGCSVILLPSLALLALRWALRQGEFDHLQKTALSIFDDEEPVGLVTDGFPNQRENAPNGHRVEPAVEMAASPLGHRQQSDFTK